MDSKLVSVVITTYNRDKLLSRAIDSVLIQDYPNLEIIISDDCSENDVRALVALKQKETSIPIKYRCNDVNSGACFTRNEGIKAASGFFITGLDDDDEFTPDRVGTLLRSYEPKYSFITSNTLVVGRTKKFKLFTDKDPRAIYYEDCLWDNIIGTQVFVERKRLLELGGFDTNLTSAQDIDMWLRLINAYGPAQRLPEVSYILHTEHDAPRISTSKNKLNGLKCFYDKYKLDMTSSQKKYFNFVYKYWEAGRKFNLKLLLGLDFKSSVYLLKKFFIKFM